MNKKILAVGLIGLSLLCVGVASALEWTQEGALLTEIDGHEIAGYYRVPAMTDYYTPYSVIQPQCVKGKIPIWELDNGNVAVVITK